MEVHHIWNVWFEKIFKPPTKDGYLVCTPLPPRIFQFSFILFFQSLAIETPHPPPLMTILGVGMDMFWTHTMCSNMKMFLHTGVGFLSCIVFLLSTVVFRHFSSKSKFKNGFGIHDKDSPRHGCLKKNFIDYR